MDNRHSIKGLPAHTETIIWSIAQKSCFVYESDKKTTIEPRGIFLNRFKITDGYMNQLKITCWLHCDNNFKNRPWIMPSVSFRNQKTPIEPRGIFWNRFKMIDGYMNHLKITCWLHCDNNFKNRPRIMPSVSFRKKNAHRISGNLME